MSAQGRSRARTSPAARSAEVVQRAELLRRATPASRASARRVRAVLRRHAYLILKSPTRIVSMMYYPTVTMIVWALLTLYLAPTNSFLKDAPGFFIGAVLLWDVLFRGQLGVSLTFIEEFYARNLGNLFVSPLTLPEYIVGQLAISVLRALVGVGGACVFAYLLFRFSIFSLGLPLIAFFVNLLVFGWGIGLAMSGVILRIGLERRGARVGGDLHHRAGIGRLLSDLRPAVVVEARCVGAAFVAHVRRDAGAPARRRLPLGSFLGGGFAQRRLSRAWRGSLRVVDAQRPPPRYALADGRVRSCRCG